jgi:hypothetical protein
MQRIANHGEVLQNAISMINLWVSTLFVVGNEKVIPGSILSVVGNGKVPPGNGPFGVGNGKAASGNGLSVVGNGKVPPGMAFLQLGMGKWHPAMAFLHFSRALVNAIYLKNDLAASSQAGCAIPLFLFGFLE